MTPKPSLTVKIRKTFEDFSSDPTMVAALKKLYKTPDDVDLVVGRFLPGLFGDEPTSSFVLMYFRSATVRRRIRKGQFIQTLIHLFHSEEELFPGTTMPVSILVQTIFDLGGQVPDVFPDFRSYPISLLPLWRGEFRPLQSWFCRHEMSSGR
jgi:hypothetical protein